MFDFNSERFYKYFLLRFKPTKKILMDYGDVDRMHVLYQCSGTKGDSLFIIFIVLCFSLKLFKNMSHVFSIAYQNDIDWGAYQVLDQICKRIFEVHIKCFVKILREFSVAFFIFKSLMNNIFYIIFVWMIYIYFDIWMCLGYCN